MFELTVNLIIGQHRIEVGKNNVSNKLGRRTRTF